MTEQEKQFLRSYRQDSTLEAILANSDQTLVQKIFETNVRILMAIRGFLTLKDFASAANIDPQIFGKIISGKKNICTHTEFLPKISTGLEVDFYTILFVDLKDAFEEKLKELKDS